jgi:hypothetical protein
VGRRLFLLSAVPVDFDGRAAHESRVGIQPREVHRFIVMAIDRRTDASSDSGWLAKSVLANPR